jgi:hypothetical protein
MCYVLAEGVVRGEMRGKTSGTNLMKIQDFLII